MTSACNGRSLPVTYSRPNRDLRVDAYRLTGTTTFARVQLALPHAFSRKRRLPSHSAKSTGRACCTAGGGRSQMLIGLIDEVPHELALDCMCDDCPLTTPRK